MEVDANDFHEVGYSLIRGVYDFSSVIAKKIVQFTELHDLKV